MVILTKSKISSLFIFPLLAQESCIKGAVTVRGGVMKFILVGGSDTLLHGVHTDTACFQSHCLDQVKYLYLSTFGDTHSA